VRNHLYEPPMTSPTCTARPSVAERPQFALEFLEARQLLAGQQWVPFAVLLQQDKAVDAYPYLTGSDQTVALVDRGVDYRHPQLGNGAMGPGQKVVGGYNFRDNNTNILDDYGHGTGVAGIIAADPYQWGGYNQGVAVGTHLLMLKQESSANIKDALDWLIANHAQYNIQVVNLTDFITDVLPQAWNPDIYAPELQTLHDLNIFVVSPVGNGELFGLAHFGGSPPIVGPSASPYVMGAGGVMLGDTMWNDSLRGPGLDILGPSYNVTMTYYLQNKVNGVGVGGYDQYDDNYTGTDVLANYAQGTSWASAYVAGTATLLKQINPAFTPDQIRDIIIQTGDPVHDNENPAITYPRLNIYKALTLGFQMADDAYYGNTNFNTATPVGFTKGKAAFSNLKLTIGHPDNFTFNVNKTGKVNIKVTGAPQMAAVFNSAGTLVNYVPATKKGLSGKLPAGKYYVYFSNATTMQTPYGFTISGGSGVVGAARRAAVTAATAFNSSSTGFATTAATAADTTGASPSDVLLGKNQTTVFA
jgi:subtilisin family serine protease